MFQKKFERLHYTCLCLHHTISGLNGRLGQISSYSWRTEKFTPTLSNQSWKRFVKKCQTYYISWCSKVSAKAVNMLTLHSKTQLPQGSHHNTYLVHTIITDCCLVLYSVFWAYWVRWSKSHVLMIKELSPKRWSISSLISSNQIGARLILYL